MPLIAASALAALLSGQVISITDGDTLTVLVDQQQVKVRLAEIDAPEKAQAFGSRSRQSLTVLCHHRPATVHPVATDRYGRMVAKVSCAGTDAATYQVSTGMAWVFDRYAASSSPLYGLQQAAKNARLGLWADASPAPPWTFRMQKVTK